MHSLAGHSVERLYGLRSRSVSGRPLYVRFARNSDIEPIAEMLQQLSSASLTLRYLTPKPLEAAGARMEARRMLAQAELAGTVLLVSTPNGDGERLVGLGELAIDPAAATRAEFALVVRDDYQADGIGTLLMHALVTAAAQAGVVTLGADLAPSNVAMRRLIRKLDLPYSLTLGPYEWTLALQLA